METELTPMRASDVAEIARIHRLAFPNFFLSTLGEPFLRQFYKGHLNDPTAVAVVLRDISGKPVGAAVGTTEPSGFFRRLVRRQGIGFALTSAAAVLRHPRAASRLLRGAFYRGEVAGVAKPEGALWSSMCADPAAQGQGVGRKLMAGWESAARRLGAQQAYLTTDALDNDRINEWYQRAGWVLTDTYRTREGRPMNLYMKDLHS